MRPHNKIIGSEFKSENLVKVLVARSEHQHGHLRALPAQLAAHVKSVDPRQHDVDQHDVGWAKVEDADRFLAAAGLVAFAVSISSVGLPGQLSFFVSVAPICLAIGAPIELLPLLLAVEVIPDIFRTVGNVTADLAVTTILNRKDKGVRVIAPETA